MPPLEEEVELYGTCMPPLEEDEEVERIQRIAEAERRKSAEKERRRAEQEKEVLRTRTTPSYDIIEDDLVEWTPFAPERIRHEEKKFKMEIKNQKKKK